MKKSVSRAALAVATVAALGLTTACGGDSDEGGKGGSSGKSTADGASAAKPLTEAQLRKAALVKADVKGFEIQKMTAKDLSEGGKAKAADAKCQPLASMMGAQFDPAPAASVFRTYAKENATLDAGNPASGSTGMIRVSSYEQVDAERTVKELKDAVAACSGGFAATDGAGKEADVAKVTSLAAPELGDEAMAYSMVDKGKEDAVIKFAVVRSGGQMTVFFGFNMFDPKKPELPQKLLSAQVAKVEKAAKA